MKNMLNKHKQWLIPPLIVLPFLFLIFYVLGGGRAADKNIPTAETDGANYQLPEADRQIGILDKKEAYQRQDNWKEEKKVVWDVDTSSAVVQTQLSADLGEDDSRDKIARHMKKQEESVKAALGEPRGEYIETVLPASNRNLPSKATDKVKRINRDDTKPGGQKPEKSTSPASFEAMEKLIESHETLARKNDSLQNQLQRMQGAFSPEKQLAPPVKTMHVASVRTRKPVKRNQQIVASIMGDCTVRSGNRVMMRLEQDVVIDNQKIKAGTLIYGLCKTDNERLQLQVTSVSCGGSFLTVDLSGYDTDGIRGLYIPDRAARKMYKDVTGDINPSRLITADGNALGYMGLNAAGDMARTMLKSVREKKVHLRKNTLVILKNN